MCPLRYVLVPSQQSHAFAPRCVQVGLFEMPNSGRKSCYYLLVSHVQAILRIINIIIIITSPAYHIQGCLDAKSYHDVPAIMNNISRKELYTNIFTKAMYLWYVYISMPCAQQSIPYSRLPWRRIISSCTCHHEPFIIKVAIYKHIYQTM